jgi:hypothetical protein
VTRLAVVKLVVAAGGVLVWGYGARIDDERIRLGGMIVIAVAVVLRWLPTTIKDRIDGVHADAPPDQP